VTESVQGPERLAALLEQSASDRHDALIGLHNLSLCFNVG
jgi:hypothetical protein